MPDLAPKLAGSLNYPQFVVSGAYNSPTPGKLFLENNGRNGFKDLYDIEISAEAYGNLNL